MTRIVAVIDRVLLPLGFDRDRRIWRRGFARGVDIVSLQQGKYGEDYAVNLGVLDSPLYQRCWGEDPPDDVDEAHCTVRTRLSDRREDRAFDWWSWDRPNEALAAALTTDGLRFLDQMHDRAEMERHLEMKAGRERYPPPIIYLAFLKQMRGDLPQACELLRGFAEKTRGAWKPRVAEVIAELGC